MLQFFLALNLVVIGALATIAAQHAYAHFRPHHDEPAAKGAKPKQPPVPPAVRERLIAEAELKFQAALDKTVEQLQRDLTGTVSHINKQMVVNGSEVIDREMKSYHDELAQLHEQAKAAVSEYQDQISRYQTELQTKLAEDAAAETALLKERLDTRLGDAVSAFLLETLQHEVDLGAQEPYLIAQLEAHKDELLEGLRDETKTAK